MSKLVTKDSLKAFRRQTDEKYVIEGEYSPSTGVGEADRLTPYGPNSGARDNTPFLFQTSGGESDIGSLAYFNELRGNTIRYNQKAPYFDTKTQNGITATASNNGRKLTFSSPQGPGTVFYYELSGEIRSGHKFIFLIDKCDVNTNLDSTDPHFYFGFETSVGSINVVPSTNILTASYDYHKFFIGIVSNGDVISGSIEDVRIYDLTDMFGAGNEPADYQEFVKKSGIVSWGNRSAGELKSAKPSVYKIVGYNACDGVFKKSYWINNGIEEAEGDIPNEIITQNFIKVIPGEAYTIEVEFDDDNNLDDSIYIWQYDSNKNYIEDSNLENGEYYSLSEETHYIKIGVYCSMEIDLEKTHVCCHLTWDESKTGYEEHYHETYPLPNIPLRKVGNVYDTLTHEGKLTRRVGAIGLGDLEWEKDINFDNIYVTVNPVANIKAVNDTANVANILVGSSIYVDSVDNLFVDNGNDETIRKIGVDEVGFLVFYDGLNSNESLEEFQESVLGGAPELYYELDEPVETTDEEYAFTYKTIIDDFGTQEFIGSDVPVGNEFFYVADYKAFLDSFYNKMGGDANNAPTKSDTKKPKNLNNVNQNNKDTSFVHISQETIGYKANIEVVLDNTRGAHFHNGSYVSRGQCWGKPYGNKKIELYYSADSAEHDPSIYTRVDEKVESNITYGELLSDLFGGIEFTQVYSGLDDSVRGWLNCPFDKIYGIKYFSAGFEAEIEWDEDATYASDENPLADYLIEGQNFDDSKYVQNLSVAARRAIKFKRNIPYGAVASEWLEMLIYITNDGCESGTALLTVGLKRRTFR